MSTQPRKDFQLGETLSRHPQRLTPVELELCGSKIRAMRQCVRRGEAVRYCGMEKAAVRRCFEFYGFDLGKME